MSTLHIERWHSRYLSEQALDTQVIETWEASLQHVNLDAELQMLNPADEWIAIRHISLYTRLHYEQGEHAAGLSWRQALNQALAHTLESCSPTNLVRYPNLRSALTDMLYRAACGDLQRVWAWRQMGLLLQSTSSQPVQPDQILAAAARLLIAEPSQIWPQLSLLILAEPSTGAFSQVLRCLSPSLWAALLSACPQTRFYQRHIEHHPVASPSVLSSLPPTVLVSTLLQWVEQHPWQSLPHRTELTLLLAAASHEPDGYLEVAAASVATLLARVEGALSQRLQTLATPAHTPRRALDPTARQQEHSNPVANAESNPQTQPAPIQSHDTPESTAPQLPNAGSWAASEWVGLLFLVNLLPPSAWLGAFEALMHCEAPDAGRQLLWHLACAHLNIPATDPAVRAFCGGWQPQAQQLHSAASETQPATRLLIAAELDPIAGQLARAIELKLATLPELDLVSLCQRRGSIHFEPGWIDIHQPIAQVDVRVRRAALDLNPGWLPWLGCVLRFIYV